MSDVQSTQHTCKSIQYMPMCDISSLLFVSTRDDSSTSKYLRTVSQSQRFNSNKLNKHLSKLTAQYYSSIPTPPIKDGCIIIIIDP